MKIKTREATPRQLDWLVAKCENVPVRFSAPHEQLLVEGYAYMVWQPHANWAQGGPIIEREGIDLWSHNSGDRCASNKHRACSGPTLLIAAMRCYVASKLGDEVDVPEELT